MDSQGGKEPPNTSKNHEKLLLLLWRVSTVFILLASLAFVTIDAFVENPSFKPGPSQEERAKLLHSHSYFFAALLKDNESIIDNWAHQLVRVTEALRPAPVYVSIVENHDSSDKTGTALKFLKNRLEKLGVNNTIVTEAVRDRAGRDRISWLSELRNLALEPLYQLNWSTKSTRIVFLNDVWFHSEQILDLILTNRGDYDMSCALDFYWKFYDVWVSRDLKGQGLYGIYPYFQDATARIQLRDLEPVRVFSCWNGAVVIKAEPFMKKLPIKFRPSPLGSPVHSECFWICYDLWKSGYYKILINPKVILAYERKHYYYQKYIFPIFVHPLSRLYVWLTSPASLQNPDSANLISQKVPTSALGWNNYL